MQGKVALEEHFAIPETLQDSAGFVPGDYWTELQHRLLDIQDTRLKLMDAHGIETMILSLNAPAVQAIPDKKKAIEIARRANDVLAEECAKRPDRFLGFAALPLQDPDAATEELQRCINDLGFVGALVNGFSQEGDGQTPLYYDLPQYRPFWGEVEKLGVPFYLHPRNPLPQDSRIYEGHPWLLGPTWAFAQETAVHALRLMASGLFDEHPRLNIILGHMGEGLPYMMWRIDHRNAWVKLPPRYPAKRRFVDYFNENFHITTSGNFRTQTLIDAILEVGADRILFSTDWPFENIDHASDWFNATSIAEADRVKIGRTNARRLFNLDGA
ncbi:gamma-resorcylate decarboxylase [Rhizobium rhizogenes]|uniref:Gamma-resorcylate decarboxylase n=1 Tax=Rhizobium rhizogenes TaxID=359 RepID=A0AA88EZL9_RHIRH|nr:gamma-resorcylate decarboxylase [Rhizobium rhizogenes]KAA3500977.1 gamma-resorcylate decarboxylase [Rhizobium rhizogenes]